MLAEERRSADLPLLAPTTSTRAPHPESDRPRGARSYVYMRRLKKGVTGANTLDTDVTRANWR